MSNPYHHSTREHDSHGIMPTQRRPNVYDAQKVRGERPHQLYDGSKVGRPNIPPPRLNTELSPSGKANTNYSPVNSSNKLPYMNRNASSSASSLGYSTIREDESPKIHTLGSHPEGSVTSPPYPLSSQYIPYPENYSAQMNQSLVQKRFGRKQPPSGLEPILPSQEMDYSRRIVSSPTVPYYNAATGAYYNHMPDSNDKYQAADGRTKSLTSASHKYFNQNPKTPQSQLGNFPSQQQQQQQQQAKYSNGLDNLDSSTLTNLGSSHKPLSSRSGSGSSLHHSFSLSSKSRSFTSLSKPSFLTSKKFGSSRSLQGGGKLDRNVSVSTLNSQKTVTAPQNHKPLVYPALLSRVAKIFKDSIILTINTKDGLEYHDTFTGKMAVDVICKIIRTNDRNLALLLGRSLDAQKCFHDVTYNHRLRDSILEIYAFNNVYSDVGFYQDEGNALTTRQPSFSENMQQINNYSYQQSTNTSANGSALNLTSLPPSLNDMPVSREDENNTTGVNGVFTILTNCYSPTCSRNRLCYSIACPRRLEQQARLNLKPQGGLKRAVSRLSLKESEEHKTLWYETVPKSILDKLDKREKMRQELIYEFVYTERDYVKDLEFMTDFYIIPLRNPANNIIPEREREAFLRTVFGGVNDLLKLARSLSEALTRRQQQQKPVIETIADVFLEYVGFFDPFIKYSGNKVFASFEHERQQQVNFKYARFLDAIERKPESRKQDLSSFLIKGVQRPARYQLLINGILKNTKKESPDYKNLLKAREEMEKVLNKINVQTGESTDRHKIMVLHRLLGKQTLEERYHFKLNYTHRIIYQVTLSRKRDNEKIDLYLFEHALLLVKHKIQNKRDQHKVFEKPMYLPLLFVNSGYDIPTMRTALAHRVNGSLVSDTSLRNKTETSTNYINTGSTGNKLLLNFFGLGSNQVHTTLFADDITNQNQVLLQIQQQQRKLIDKYDIFSLAKYETRRFLGSNKINCAVPCYGGKKLLYGTDSGVWVSTVRSINATSNEKICSDPTMVISKVYVTQIEVLVEYSKLLVLSDKTLYEFDLSCTDSLDHVKNTRSGKPILNHVSFFKTGVCDGKLLVSAARSGSYSISIFEPTNPFESKSMKNKNKKYDIHDIVFTSEPVSISFLKSKLCVGCTKGFEILSLEEGKKEPILDEADPLLDFATQRDSVTPLAIHRIGKNFLLSYSEFSFLINKNGWRTNHEWSVFWEGNPQNIALFYPYLLSFEPGFIEVRDLDSTQLLRALVGENIRFLHSNEHEALYACEENGYDIIVSIDFLNLKPKAR